MSKTIPSDERSPRGARATSATAPTTPAVRRPVHQITRRRGNRSMNTPMNGDNNVYGTYSHRTTFSR